jgi:hypothetical protein
MATPKEVSPLLAHPEHPGSTTKTRFAAAEPPTPVPGNLPKADTNISWGLPAGLPLRNDSDETLQIFRRALGINASLTGPADAAGLEAGRRGAAGIYRAVIREQQLKRRQHAILGFLVYAAHFAQIAIGAVLTALGPLAGSHAVAITVLGAANTVVAGVLALVKGQGLPERLRKDEVEFRRLQDWIEETEALLAVGVIGRDRREAGMLVESAFKKYNAAKASVDNNKPDSYVRQQVEGGGSGDGSAVVKLGLPRR